MTHTDQGIVESSPWNKATQLEQSPVLPTFFLSELPNSKIKPHSCFTWFTVSLWCVWGLNYQRFLVPLTKLYQPLHPSDDSASIIDSQYWGASRIAQCKIGHHIPPPKYPDCPCNSLEHGRVIGDYYHCHTPMVPILILGYHLSDCKGTWNDKYSWKSNGWTHCPL